MTKKLLKISALCFALLSCIFVLTAQNTEAADKKASVELVPFASDCTGVDFDFGTASVAGVAQERTSSGTIECIFGQSTGEMVVYSLANMVNTGNSNYKIEYTNVQIKAAAASLVAGNLPTTTALANFAAFAAGNADTSGPKTIYQKEYNHIGSMTQKVDLKLNIPAGTPAGYYSGAITLIIQ